MKEKTHPQYQDVLFVDSSTGTQFLIGSTLHAKEKGTYNGKEYPMVRVPISSASHPFYTKASGMMDTEGRVDKFKKRYENKKVEQQKEIAKVEEAAKAKPKKKK